MPVTKALCKIDEIPDGGAIEVGIVDDRDGLRDSLMLTRRDASVRAYRNVCPHAGRRLDWAPNQFLVEDGCVSCRRGKRTSQKVQELPHLGKLGVSSAVKGVGPSQERTSVAEIDGFFVSLKVF